MLFIRMIVSVCKHTSSHIFCVIIMIFLIQNVKILSVFTNLLQSGETCRQTPFLSCDPPPSPPAFNYFCLIHFWVNVFTFYYIGMVISILVLSFYIVTDIIFPSMLLIYRKIPKISPAMYKPLQI